MRFENKVVVITGAAGGIGKEAVRRFAAEGAKVVLVDLKEEALRQTAADLNLKEDGFLSVAADVSVEKDVQNYVDRTVAKFGRIDVFFNNAGIEGVIVPITDYPIEKFDAVIGVNLRGAFLGMKYMAYPTMGWITNKAYIAAVIGGLGSLPGAVIGGLLLGVLESFVSVYIMSTLRDVFSFSILIAFLLFRPSGLFGRYLEEKV